MRLALAQLLVEGSEPERNLQRADKLIADAAGQNCDLVLLPETIDFGWTHPDSIYRAEPIPGRFSNFFCDLSAKHNIWICVGLTEKCITGNYNSAILINRSGEIVTTHRKINLLSVEFPFYQIGQMLSVCDTEFGKIGLNICADNYLSAIHLGHSLAHMGAQLILSPSSWTVDFSVNETQDPYHEKWLKPYQQLASTNDIIIAGATSVGYIVGGPYEGKKMVGCSLCVDKSGIIAQGRHNEFASQLIVVELKIKQRTVIGAEHRNRIS